MTWRRRGEKAIILNNDDYYFTNACMRHPVKMS